MQKNNNIKANKNIEHLLHLSNALIDKRHNTQPKKTHTNNSNISKEQNGNFQYPEDIDVKRA